jgi:outer membrane protein OmpA-like peptidoglycan-associated protein
VVQTINPKFGGVMLTNQKLRGKAFLLIMGCLILATVFPLQSKLSASLVMQGVKSLLFYEVNQIRSEANNAKADILAPQSYSEAISYYENAQDQYEKGKSLDDIKKNIRASIFAFRKAIDATRVANVTFGSTMQARTDAVSAEAQYHAANLWKQAEGKFSEAAIVLEKGNLNNAKKRSAEAEKIYRQAELEAIKTNYLAEAKRFLKEAENVNAPDLAPRTYKKAQGLVKDAERELNENRYDTDVARVLARQAKREARHAIYLAVTIKKLKQNDQTWEDLILVSERPLVRISATLDIIPSFESGLGKPTDDIILKINEYQNNNKQMKADMFYANQRMALLEGQLSGVEKERTVLAKRMETQAKIRKQYASVEKIFTKEEAIFTREGNDLIIRLVGLSFPVGKANIETKYYDFLGKVIKSIAIFPNASLSIEGHTDSFGSDETNLTLSQKRAEAVTQYLQSNMKIDPSRVNAIGFGESRPLASNETEEGRAKNRRIEIKIRPQFEDSVM